MINIDGSMGEGGGQVLRTSLAVAACTGQAFRMVHVRAARARPGLQPQHLAAVRAAAAISGAAVDGDAQHSQTLSFAPGPVRPGHYHFAIGTAGSATLVLQTVLPALLTAAGPSALVLEGGTHNPLAPTYDFLEQAFVPLINRMGPRVSLQLERPGFYPRGGGCFTAHITPCERLAPLFLRERGAVLAQRAAAIVADLPRHIGERELQWVSRELQLPAAALELREAAGCGPGNVVSLTVRSEQLSEVFAAFGERGVPAERVAATVVQAARRYLSAGVPVGEHLADQLLLPLALAGGGAFLTVTPTGHTRTSIALLEQLLSVRFALREQGGNRWEVTVTAP